MKYLILSALLLTTPIVLAYQDATNICAAQIVSWDSDGHSPYANHAQCAAQLPATFDGATVTLESSTEDAGGVGFATFICKKGTFVIDTAHFGAQVQSSGYCAD